MSDKEQNYCEGLPKSLRDRGNGILNLRLVLANRNSANIWGKGFQFITKNEKLEKDFRRIDKQNGLLNLFSHCEKELSLKGRVILAFQKQLNGDVKIVPALPYFFNGVAKIIRTPTLAVIYTRYIIDTSNYIVKSTYTLDKVVNELYMPDKNGAIVRMLGAEETFKELGIVEVWNHNLGFVPLFEITNLPMIEYYWNNFNFITLADWYPAQQFEDLFQDTLINLKKELYYNHSRVFVDDADQKVIDQITSSISRESDYTFNPQDDIVIQTEAGSKTTFQSGNGDYLKYVNSMEAILDLYFKFANASRISEGGGAQKTASETSQARGNLVEFLNMKITNREEIYSDLINKLLIANGMWSNEFEQDFTFKINGNMSEDNTSKIDNLIKQVQIGSMSIVDMIAQVENISNAKAKDRYEEIKEFNEENDIMTSLAIGGGANLSIDEEGGAPTKNDPNQDKGEEA